MSKSTLTFISKSFKKLNCWNELNCGTHICRATPGKNRQGGHVTAAWLAREPIKKDKIAALGVVLASWSPRPQTDRDVNWRWWRHDSRLHWPVDEKMRFPSLGLLIMRNGTTSRLFFWIFGRCFNDFPKFMSGCFDSQRPVMPCHRMNVVQYNVDSQYKMSCSVQFWSYF